MQLAACGNVVHEFDCIYAVDCRLKRVSAEGVKVVAATGGIGVAESLATTDYADSQFSDVEFLEVLFGVGERCLFVNNSRNHVHNVQGQVCAFVAVMIDFFVHA